jgi:HME family heavy-metal exporter
LSVIFVEFDWNTDIYINRQQVAERLAVVREQLPAHVVPQMASVSSIMGEIMLIALQGKDMEPMHLRELADWVIRPRLLTLAGVAQVIPIGGEIRQYRIIPDPAMMADLGISLNQLENAIKDFASNTSGGFLEYGGQEILIRNIGRTTKISDLNQLVVGFNGSQPILLQQVAAVAFVAQVKRGDASFNAAPAVILSVQKQPNTDTVRLTHEVEAALVELEKTLPKAVKATILFKQARFIENSVHNVEEALRDGAIMVAIILFMFLLNLRTTFISLTAIPLSLLTAALIFAWFDLSINTMTLGGLAIAIGELVDDAVVGVENVFRRLRQQRQNKRPIIDVIADATLEVRSAIVYATLIIVLVFVPLFALSGIEGRLFMPLGIAYIVSILASMVVSITVTPVLCYYLIPRMKLDHDDSLLVRGLKWLDERILRWSFGQAKTLMAMAVMLVVATVAGIPFLKHAFLPPFNEGTLTISVLTNPGTSLTESNRMGHLAEQRLLSIAEVTAVGRRTGRAELDEHAEGVHSSEIDVDMKPLTRPRDEFLEEVRDKLADLPATISVGQPISHRLDHMLSGVRAQIAVKVFGDDLAVLRSQAAMLKNEFSTIKGLVDLRIEKQVLIPQQQIQIDYPQAAVYGVTPAAVNRALATLVGGAS